MIKYYNRFEYFDDPNDYSDYLEENDIEFDFEDDDNEDEFIYTENF